MLKTVAPMAFVATGGGMFFVTPSRTKNKACLHMTPTETIRNHGCSMFNVQCWAQHGNMAMEARPI